MTIAEPHPVPGVGPLRAPKLPAVADTVLSNGLRVLAARRSGVPRVEARLVVPVARGSAAKAAERAVLAKALLSGTESSTSFDIATRLQSLGASLDVTSSTEDVTVFGSALAPNLRAFLDVIAEVVAGANYPEGEVELQRERTAQELSIALSQPETIARQAFLGRLYGKHPYGHPLPTPDEARKVRTGALRKFHEARLLPAGSILIVVGDVTPSRAVAAVESAFEVWTGESTESRLPVPKPAPPPGRIVLVDRPAAVQTNVRIGGPAIGRGEPDYPALALANLVFGGYFVSRLVDNIRERRGYTYSPGSGVTQLRRAAHFITQADVGSEVTAPALVEMRYELSRMVAGPFEPSELESAKRYLAGTLSMSIQTQSGLAAYLAVLAVHGLGIEYLRELPRAVDRLTADDVLGAAQRFFAPRLLHTVLVGDASVVEPAIAALDDVEVVRSE